MTEARDVRSDRWPIVVTRRTALKYAMAAAFSAYAGDRPVAAQAETVPDWVAWHDAAIAADLDGDGTDELVSLEKGTATVTDGEKALFETSAEWLVSDVLVGDIDVDGTPEVALVVWKRGSYGDVRPFWIEADEEGYSQHIFIYRWRDASLQPIWMSSKLPVEAERVSLVDGKTFVIEDPGGNVTLWEWQSWGLALVGRHLEPGTVLSRTEVLAFGDNIAHANIYEGAYVPSSRTYDFSPLYAHVRNRIADADLALVVQETPLVRNAALRSSYPVFATPAAMADALALSGFDVALSASNHVNDQGERGLEDTLSYWEEHHPEVTVAGVRRAKAGRTGPQAVLCNANGIRLAVFDCTYGLNGRELSKDGAFTVDTVESTADEKRLTAAVARVRDRADLVVCFLHIGTEYDPEPPALQKNLVRRLVAAGAAAVICSHTHVLGPYGTLKTSSETAGVVFWGLGNFVSGQTDLPCILGGAARLELEKSIGADGVPETRVVAYELLPTVCHLGRDGSAAAYFLDDYTELLAAEHLARSPDDPLSLTDLADLVPQPSFWDYSESDAASD